MSRACVRAPVRRARRTCEVEKACTRVLTAHTWRSDVLRLGLDNKITGMIGA
jgi:hypothetical protein